MELFRVLQRANLTSYYDAFISQGGDDLSQLAEAEDEEFLEMMRLIGMANKPLHMRRLQKTLLEWKLSPEKFRVISEPTESMINNLTTQYISPSSPSPPPLPHHSHHQQQHQQQQTVYPNQPNGFSAFQDPLKNLFLNAENINSLSFEKLFDFKNFSLNIRPPAASISKSANSNIKKNLTSSSSGQSRGIPVSLLPNATLSPEKRIEIEQAAEELAKHLPDYPVKIFINKTKKDDELISVMNMPTNHPTRLSAIYKYSAIYGRFDRPRKTYKPMNHHEVSVNEAAAQLCLRIPNLLSRREDLYPLARQVVRMAENNWKEDPKSSRRHCGQKKNKDMALIDALANQIGAFYANEPELGILNLTEKISTIKGELFDLVQQYDELRMAFRSAKTETNPFGQRSMSEIQKQVDCLTAIRQTKMNDLARLIQEVRRFKLRISDSKQARSTASDCFNATASFLLNSITQVHNNCQILSGNSTNSAFENFGFNSFQNNNINGSGSIFNDQKSLESTISKLIDNCDTQNLNFETQSTLNRLSDHIIGRLSDQEKNPDSLNLSKLSADAKNIEIGSRSFLSGNHSHNDSREEIQPNEGLVSDLNVWNDLPRTNCDEQFCKSISANGDEDSLPQCRTPEPPINDQSILVIGNSTTNHCKKNVNIGSHKNETNNLAPEMCTVNLSVSAN